MRDLAEKLRQAFRVECREHLAFIREALPQLFNCADPTGDGAVLDDAYRRAHSLKGAARAVDLEPVEQIAHKLETLLSQIRSGERPAENGLLPIAESALDAIEDATASMLNGGEPPDLRETFSDLDTMIGVGAEPRQFPSSDSATTTPSERNRPKAETGERRSAPAPAGPHPADDTVRVRFRHLDQLVASTGELLSEELRQQAVTGSLEGTVQAVGALQKEWDRVRRSSARGLRELRENPEFGALIRHLDGAEKQLRNLGRSASASLAKQRESAWNHRRITDQIQQDVREARMVPADSIFDPFRKMVRDLAAMQGKQVDFLVSGMHTVADRMVLQALKDPVMHLLRNALDHGLQTPQERRRAGMPERGGLELKLETEGSRLIFEVRDDGRGLNLERLTSIADGQGYAEQADGRPAPADPAQLIFAPGISTAESVSELSGRGMGLSVVDEAVRRLQGEVEVPELNGAPGFAVVIRVPLSVSLQRLLLVECQDRGFAIPFHGLESVRHVTREDVTRVEGELTIADDDRRLPMTTLPTLLNFENTALNVDGKYVPVLVLRSGSRRLAVAVDRVVKHVDALVKELDTGSSSVRHLIAGGIVMSDGTVNPVLNPAGLVDDERTRKKMTEFTVTRSEIKHAPTILVTDDSFTTRTLERSLLEAHGYIVREAVDGVDALQRIRSEPVDLVVTDLQMPRLDGFGLLKAIKQEQSTRHIPVIIVSSLEQREEKERGLSLGADAYVVKRKFDQRELLKTIEQML